MNTDLVTHPRAIALAGPLGSLDAYVQAVSSLPVISADEERKLARSLRNQGDLGAARELVLAHLRFVVHIARGYSGYGLPMGDLIQEGNVGLMKAVKRFDPEVGVRLVSFAVHWIRAEIHEFVIRNWRLVRIATTKAQRKLFFKLRGAKRHLGWLSREETEVIARDLGVSPRDVAEMEQRLAGQDLVFDPLPDADDEGPVAPALYLPAPDADPAEALEAGDWETTAAERLGQAMEKLDDRSRDIMTARWVNEPKATLQELADRYGISAERVRQIEQQAMRQMRRALEA
ncbi:MAG: RNA polymerase sigma factor RpoH [Gammaproteobacteria bacterium]|nr:RNA polymerase sigma factor RpoH [Gammaproteobacteria bacterium]